MGSLFAHPQSTIASDSLYLPRIHPNGQSLYDSLDKASTYMVINKLVTQVCPINILLFVPQPTLSLMLYGLLYYVYQVLPPPRRAPTGPSPADSWSRLNSSPKLNS
jgi:hypothetical protein